MSQFHRHQKVSEMSDELQDFDDQLQELLKDIQSTLTKDIPKLSGRQKVEVFSFPDICLFVLEAGR